MLGKLRLRATSADCEKNCSCSSAEETANNYLNRFHPEARVVTAAIDNIFIRHAADVTRDLVCQARIN